MHTNELKRLKAAMQVFSQIDHKMQVGTALTLLEIADAEHNGQDISTQDLEKRIGFQSGAASRNVYYWGDGHKEMGGGGHKMITVTMNVNDRRRRDLRLTPKGHALMNRVKELVGNGEATR